MTAQYEVSQNMRLLHTCMVGFYVIYNSLIFKQIPTESFTLIVYQTVQENLTSLHKKSGRHTLLLTALFYLVIATNVVYFILSKTAQL